MKLLRFFVFVLLTVGFQFSAVADPSVEELNRKFQNMSHEVEQLVQKAIANGMISINFSEVDAAAVQVADRYRMTEENRKKFLQTMHEYLTPLVLNQFKEHILSRIAQRMVAINRFTRMVTLGDASFLPALTYYSKQYGIDYSNIPVLIFESALLDGDSEVERLSYAKCINPFGYQEITDDMYTQLSIRIHFGFKIRGNEERILEGVGVSNYFHFLNHVQSYFLGASRVVFLNQKLLSEGVDSHVLNGILIHELRHWYDYDLHGLPGYEAEKEEKEKLEVIFAQNKQRLMETDFRNYLENDMRDILDAHVLLASPQFPLLGRNKIRNQITEKFFNLYQGVVQNRFFKINSADERRANLETHRYFLQFGLTREEAFEMMFVAPRRLFHVPNWVTLKDGTRVDVQWSPPVPLLRRYSDELYEEVRRR